VLPTHHRDAGRGHRAALLVAGVAAALGATAGCGSPHEIPAEPTWADVAPVLRGECVSCHGWTAAERVCPGFGDPQTQLNCQSWQGGERHGTGGGFRFDFYDVTSEVCGDAALALDPSLVLAGAAGAAAQIATDVVRQNGAGWPRMPPQPSPSLPAWEIETLARWTAHPTKGPPPVGNRVPTVAVSQFPASADGQLAFTAIIDDPDGDSVLGVVEVGNLAFPMNRPGSFAVQFDSTSWPSGVVRPTVVVCDGWTSSTIDLGPVQIQH
jgi:hypothetical protein